MKIGKFKISKTLAIIIIIVLIIVGYYVIKSFLKNPLDEYIAETVSTGQVSEEISETGSVKATEDFSLSFRGTGRIAKINVFSGQEVKQGEILAELDLTQIQAQLRSAQAALSAANTQYEKLLAGFTPQDIKSYEQNLDTAYVSAQNALNDAYSKIYNSTNFIKYFQTTYFPTFESEAMKVGESMYTINDNERKVKNQMDIIKQNPSKENIDTALLQTIKSLGEIFQALKTTRDVSETWAYDDQIPQVDKTSLETQITYINTALTSVTSAEQSISSYRIALQKAEATPRTEDIDIYLSQISQAQANVDLYQSQLNDNYIRSPINGKITEIFVKRGETVSPNQPIINLLSVEPFQVKVNIYEQDIVDVKIGNTAKIELVAFPKQIFDGKVIAIEPAEKIIDNVVYYEITIDFPQQPEGVRSGMTADVVVLVNEKSDVLRLSKSAVESIDGKEFVQVINRGKIDRREIKTGLEGSGYYEVISGLEEGEEIIIGKK